MTIGEICSRAVVLAYRNTPLRDAARLMRQHHVGSLVVIEENERGRVPVGIITDRDIVVEVVAMDLDCGTVMAGDVMAPKLISVREEESVLDVLRTMRRHGIRRVPVVSASDTLTGIVTLDDIIDVVAQGLEDLRQAIAGERSKEVRTRG